MHVIGFVQEGTAQGFVDGHSVVESVTVPVTGIVHDRLCSGGHS